MAKQGCQVLSGYGSFEKCSDSLSNYALKHWFERLNRLIRINDMENRATFAKVAVTQAKVARSSNFIAHLKKKKHRSRRAKIDPDMILDNFPEIPFHKSRNNSNQGCQIFKIYGSFWRSLDFLSNDESVHRSGRAKDKSGYDFRLFSEVPFHKSRNISRQGCQIFKLYDSFERSFNLSNYGLKHRSGWAKDKAGDDFRQLFCALIFSYNLYK